jgi:DNA polymerase
MVTQAESTVQIPRSLAECRRCDLWREANHAVGGTGPRDARMMLVGEQPGDAEDLAGAPFVGPAGQVLDRALAQAGLRRDRLFVTNAVKHFKHELRGKRRLHKRPDTGEIVACRFWLDQERAALAPRVIVALGATAAFAVLGRHLPVLASRGRVFDAGPGSRAVITIHPSYLLRIRDEPAKTEAMAGFVADLEVAASLARAPT